MEEQENNVNSLQTEKQNAFNTVTPLSRTLALVLFVALPFVGFWLGYRFAPEKVVEIEKLTEKTDVVQNEENIVTYEECAGMGGAINNLTNDCWVNGEIIKTPYSRKLDENSDTHKNLLTLDDVFALIELAQVTGDYSLCEKTETHRKRCIAEVELQQTILHNYGCNDSTSCNNPECYAYMGCGGGGGDDAVGCSVQEYCAVDQSWLCGKTGGVGGTKDGFNCVCPEGSNFIKGYGCAKCSDFAHEETRSYCENGVSYFQYLYAEGGE